LVKGIRNVLKNAAGDLAPLPIVLPAPHGPAHTDIHTCIHTHIYTQYPNYADTLFRYYIDDDPSLMLEFEWFLAHGVGFGDQSGVCVCVCVYVLCACMCEIYTFNKI